MYERFTDRARQLMQFANQEAQRLNHEFIATEHLLLGLIKVANGTAVSVLHGMGVQLPTVRRETERLVDEGPPMVTMGKLPQTPRSKKVIEYAMEEARNLNHNYVGTEHLLLGMLREQEGIAAQILMNFGVRLEETREAVIAELDPRSEEPPREAAPEAEPVQSPVDDPPLPPRVFHHVRLVLVRRPIKPTGWFAWLKQPQFEMVPLVMDRVRATVRVRSAPFTPAIGTDVNSVIARANEFAKAHKREYVSPAELLFGIVATADGVLGRVFRMCGLTPERVAEAIRAVVPDGHAEIFMTSLPGTPNGRAVWETANRNAQSDHCEKPSVLHLLEAVLDSDDLDLSEVWGKLQIPKASLQARVREMAADQYA